MCPKRPPARVFKTSRAALYGILTQTQGVFALQGDEGQLWADFHPAYSGDQRKKVNLFENRGGEKIRSYSGHLSLVDIGGMVLNGIFDVFRDWEAMLKSLPPL